MGRRSFLDFFMLSLWISILTRHSKQGANRRDQFFELDARYDPRYRIVANRTSVLVARVSLNRDVYFKKIKEIHV